MVAGQHHHPHAQRLQARHRRFDVARSGSAMPSAPTPTIDGRPPASAPASSGSSTSAGSGVALDRKSGEPTDDLRPPTLPGNAFAADRLNRFGQKSTPAPARTAANGDHRTGQG